MILLLLQVFLLLQFMRKIATARSGIALQEDQLRRLPSEDDK